MNIIKKHYPHDDHIFIFDNTPTHVKRASDAISACNMPINPSAPGKNWLIKVPSLDNNGKQIFDASGKRVSKSIPMAPGTFAEGTPQSFYFPDGHRQASQFKGMRIILEERGFLKEELEKLKRECLGFRCPAGKTNCCIQRILYSQPDFQSVGSVFKDHCTLHGFGVLFLPKFHPKLNPLKQCWGCTKWYYRQLLPSSKEHDLERNFLEALESISLDLIRQYVIYIFFKFTQLISPDL